MTVSDQSFNLKYVYAIALISAMGGFLFGYDWVVIGGAKPFYELFFGITGSTTLQGWAVSSALVGCIFGAMVSGVVSDTIGRKWPLVVSALLFLVSAFGSGYADGFTAFIVYRLVGGLGIGLASTLSPMYIAEIAPSPYRGRFVAINQLTIVVGILLAQIANYLIAEPVPPDFEAADILSSWNGQQGWRWMFWAEIIPAAVFLFSMLFVPESPRFMAKHHQYKRAGHILMRIGGADYAKEQLDSIKKTLASEKTGRSVAFSELRGRKLLTVLIIGVVLAFFQQWCGINVIFNYADEIFTAAGYSVGDMLFNIVVTGSVNLVFTLVAMNTVDKWGRRRLMLFGALGLALVYAMLGSAYYFEFSGWPVLLLVVMAIAIYAMSLAPITWVILSEIFPNRLRGLAMSIATFSLWIASFILTFSFPVLNQELGSYGTFWLYSLICLGGYVFIKKKLPETKEKSLEEIETELTGKNENRP